MAYRHGCNHKVHPMLVPVSNKWPVSLTADGESGLKE
jgi:hypothetical protein